MTHLTITEYREMVDNIIEFNKTNGEMPKFANINDRKIPRKDYSVMINNVNKFLLEHGRTPSLVQIK